MAPRHISRTEHLGQPNARWPGRKVNEVVFLNLEKYRLLSLQVLLRSRQSQDVARFDRRTADRSGLPGGPFYGHFDRFLGGLTDFDRLQGGTDLRILGPILASAEIFEE